MKFGKSIRLEARTSRNLYFLGFKYLKRVVKRCEAACRAGKETVAADCDAQFRTQLESELQQVATSYWQELAAIRRLQISIQEQLMRLCIVPDPETYTCMSFEQLQAHLQSLGGYSDRDEGEEVPSDIRTSVALCDFCVDVGKISARCKRLRRCVLWNAVAVVKILKKRLKRTPFGGGLGESAAEILCKQSWYQCPELTRVVSIIETTTHELMQKLTLRPPSTSQYQCPICLDVILDPVSVRTCGHRFCWTCLTMACCEKQEGTLERCPLCRAAFPLDPEAFQVDGIMSRFLRTYFPEETRKQEQDQQAMKELLQLKERDRVKGSVDGSISLSGNGAPPREEVPVRCLGSKVPIDENNLAIAPQLKTCSQSEVVHSAWSKGRYDDQGASKSLAGCGTSAGSKVCPRVDWRSGWSAEPQIDYERPLFSTEASADTRAQETSQSTDLSSSAAATTEVVAHIVESLMKDGRFQPWQTGASFFDSASSTSAAPYALETPPSSSSASATTTSIGEAKGVNGLRNFCCNHYCTCNYHHSTNVKRHSIESSSSDDAGGGALISKSALTPNKPVTSLPCSPLTKPCSSSLCSAQSSTSGRELISSSSQHHHHHSEQHQLSHFRSSADSSPQRRGPSAVSVAETHAQQSSRNAAHRASDNSVAADALQDVQGLSLAAFHLSDAVVKTPEDLGHGENSKKSNSNSNSGCTFSRAGAHCEPRIDGLQANTTSQQKRLFLYLGCNAPTHRHLEVLRQRLPGEVIVLDDAHFDDDDDDEDFSGGEEREKGVCDSQQDQQPPGFADHFNTTLYQNSGKQCSDCPMAETVNFGAASCLSQSLLIHNSSLFGRCGDESEGKNFVCGYTKESLLL